jgi:hypothetical protein
MSDQPASRPGPRTSALTSGPSNNTPPPSIAPAPDEADVDRLVAACGALLRPPVEWAPFIGYPDSLALAVIDAIWAMIARYRITKGVITRYVGYRKLHGADATKDGLGHLLRVYESLGGVDGFVERIGTRNRVSTQPGAARKGEAVLLAAEALTRLGVGTAEQFREADGTELAERLKDAWLAIPGQRSGISWRYLRMLVGLPDVKPDRMIVRFLASALGVEEASISPDYAVLLVQAVARRFDVDQRALDHEIWGVQSGRRGGHDPVTHRQHLEALAESFIGAAFPALARERVIPTSAYHPFVEVGRDYEGGLLMSLAEFGELEAAISQAYPQRFASDLGFDRKEFPSSYIFSLVEAAVAGCALAGEEFEADAAASADSLDEFFRVLDAPEYQLRCCRAVSHLATNDGGVVRIGGVTVYPENAGEGLVGLVSDLIPASPGAYNRLPPRPYDPPHALVVSSRAITGRHPMRASVSLSGSIDRFLLLVRLLHAGTHQSLWQLCGASTRVSLAHPQFNTFEGAGMPAVDLKRIVAISEEDGPAVLALGEFLEAAVVKREGMASVSFDLALYRFNRSYEPGNDYEHLVDLATALEAILTGNERETDAISLRLKSRSAALLATPDDPARVIFDDIGVLYGLRSRIVHGGNIKETALRTALDRVSTVPIGAMFGVASAFAVDRLRDLVRRAFLARLCLAAEPNPKWPFEGTTAVDAALIDDASRETWRLSWREQLAGLGAGAAADAAAPAVDPLDPGRQ